MKLHIGCGNRRIEGFINIDVRDTRASDLVCDIVDLPYEEKSIDLIYACSVLEHFGRNSKLDFFRKTSWINALEHWHSLLSKGGKLFLSVPDFEAICLEYAQNRCIEKLIGLTIGGQKNNEDLHGMIFDYKLLEQKLLDVGFTSVERYDWWKLESFCNNKEYDDFSRSYLPHLDFKDGRLMMLNIKAVR